jgi:sporulation protein YlmC with PRC-barrel domain
MFREIIGEKVMEFRTGASVVTADGNKVGDVERVVLDPDTQQVTHIVIRKGLLFAEERVVPVNLIASTDDGQLRLREEVEDIKTLPVFEGEKLVPTGVRRGFQPGNTPGLPGHVVVGGREYIAEVKRNIPEDQVPLKKGAKVVAADGKHVGNVDELLVDPDTDRVTEFIISKGLLLKERKRIPREWVERILEGQVDLSVESEVIKDLPPFEGVVEG